MAIAETLLVLFNEYSIILALIAGLMMGDLMILLGIMAGAGKANFFLILLFGYIGGVLHDVLFYFLSNSRLMHRIKKRYRLPAKKNKIAHFIEKLGKGHYFWPILLAKFVYGVRDAVVLYVAHNHKSFKKYLLVVSLAEIIWISIITSIGWLAGRGFTSLLKLFKGLEKWLLIILIGVILIYLINKFIISMLFRKVESKRKAN